MMECCSNYYYGAAAALLTSTIFYAIFKKLFAPAPCPDLAGKHVLITGGSEGIGLAVAEEVLTKGAHVTLVSRSRSKLEAAQKKLCDIASSNMGKVQIRPCDVCSNDVEQMVTDAEKSLGPIFMLVNCAGFSVPARFDDLAVEDVKKMMDVNFMGTFAVTQSVVKRMKRQEVMPGTSGLRKGIIVLTSSQAGLLGIYGFTGYAASKAALIKFGEALHMELRPHQLSVTVSLPPDTDTPGFARENESKPAECSLISESAGLFKAEDVAKGLVNDALSGRFMSYVGLESFLLSNLSAGMAPLTHFQDFMTQVFFAGIFRLVSAIFQFQFSRIVQTEHFKRVNSKKRE